MKQDLKSNMVATLVDASASLAAAANRNSSSIDASEYGGASFIIYATSVGTGGVLTAKLQYSTDNSTWTDEPDTNAGNSTSITVNAVGLGRINAPQPRARYLRVNGAAATDAVVYSIIACRAPDLFV